MVTHTKKKRGTRWCLNETGRYFAGDVFRCIIFKKSLAPWFKPGLNNSRKNQVAHRATCWKISGCPHQESGCPLPNVIINNTVYGDFVTHSKIKCNINGILSVENNEKKLYFRKKRWFFTLNKICLHTYSRDVSSFLLLKRKSISQKRGQRSVYWRGCILYKWYIPFWQIRGELSPLFPKIWGQVVNFGKHLHHSHQIPWSHIKR